MPTPSAISCTLTRPFCNTLHVFSIAQQFLPHDAMHKRGLCCMRCLSVCVCVCVCVCVSRHVRGSLLTYSRNDLKLFCLIVRTDLLLLLYGAPGRFVERRLTNLSLYLYVTTNKYIFEIFPPSGSHTILVFPHQTGWRYSDGPPPPDGSVECRWGRQKSRFWAYIWL